jgi:hypothetical protein
MWGSHLEHRRQEPFPLEEPALSSPAPYPASLGRGLNKGASSQRAIEVRNGGELTLCCYG